MHTRFTPHEEIPPVQEQMLQALMDTSAEAILVVSDQGNILKANAESAALLGYTAEELMHASVAAVVPGLLQSPCWLHRRQRAATEKCALQLTGLHKNGKELPLNIKFSAVSSSKESMAILFMHLPEKKEQPSENNVTLENVRTTLPLTDKVPGVVYRCQEDAGRTMLYVSDSITSLTGYQPKAFYQLREGFGFQTLIHPDDRKHVQESVQQALEQRRCYSLTYRIHTIRKKEKWIWEQGQGVLSAEGRFLYTEGFLLDITHAKKMAHTEGDGQLRLPGYTEELEQKVKMRTRELTAMVKKLVETNLNLEYQMQEAKAADAQAKKNHALYVAIARYFPKVMIVVINRDYQIVFLDGEELQKTGLDKDVVEGLSIDQIRNFSPEWRTRMLEHARKTFKGKHSSYEIKYRHNNYKVNAMPLDSQPSGVNLVLFVFTNITEQKKTELKMLKALKKERELSELKSRFVSMASHEFRTPLSTILSSANLIARQNEPGKEEKRLRNVERIKSSVKNLVDILNEFLSIGRLEEGEISMKKEEFDLMEFMKSIIQELQHVQKEGQQVRLSSNRKLIPAYLDRQFTRNVFLNLISNALKYSPAHLPVDISIQAEGNTLTVRVQDQGIGIPEDEQQNLFNLFFRARNVTNIEGTGLGLPIVKKYIELMQGSISFESKLQQGSTFTIVLPLEAYRDEKNTVDRR